MHNFFSTVCVAFKKKGYSFILKHPMICFVFFPFYPTSGITGIYIRKLGAGLYTQ
jgi:hypothetical protein